MAEGPFILAGSDLMLTLSVTGLLIGHWLEDTLTLVKLARWG